MEIIEITNAKDITYPLDKNTFDDRFVVYHGTRSIYSNKIESDGWIIKDYPYDLTEMKEVYQICNSINFKGSSAQSEMIKLCFMGENLSYNPVYFTQDYWTARNYSFYPGGEAIGAIISLIDELKEILNNNSLIDKHLIYLNKQLNDAIFRNDIAVNKFKQNILNFKSLLINEEKKNKLFEIKNKYEDMVNLSNPVVYAVRISPYMFSNWKDIDIIRLLDLKASEDIHASRIVAKLNFPSGVKRFRQASKLPLPVLWEMDKFKNWLLENRQEYKEFIEFYL